MKTSHNYKKYLRILCALIVVGLLAYAPKAVKKSHKADFERYYTAGYIASQGGDIYSHKDDKEFKYFPFLAQLMSPIARVSEYFSNTSIDKITPSKTGLIIGAAIWYLILCACYLGSLAMAVSMCAPRDARDRFFIFLGGLFLSARFFIANVRNGQINLLAIFFAVFGCWLLYKKRKRLSGWMIAVGAAIKFMPALLLLWLLKKKQMLSVAHALLAIVVMLVLVPCLSWKGGVDASTKQLGAYIQARHQMVSGLPSEEAAGQSVPSMINRLLRKVNAAPLRLKKILHINVAEVDARTVKTIVLVTIIIISLIALVAVKPDGNFALQVALMFVLMLLVSPEARKAHFVSWLLPGAALTAWSLKHRAKILHPALIAAVLITILASREVVGNNMVYYYLNAFGIVMWINVALFVAIILALRSKKEKNDNRQND